ncbi:hypothetical protein BDV10DRAFT_186629 [Aspergillus recurvatus]
MRLVKRETTIPVPEVYEFVILCNNVLNCPSILMELEEKEQKAEDKRKEEKDDDEDDDDGNDGFYLYEVSTKLATGKLEDEQHQRLVEGFRALFFRETSEASGA